MDFWAGVGLAAAIATALATGVSTLAALWWRRMDRSHADWAALRTGSRWVTDRRGGAPDGPNLSATLANVGDGVAFRVSVRCEGCKAYLAQPRETPTGPSLWQSISFMPVVMPGDEIELRATCEEEQWEQAAVHIEWTRSPTWKRKRESLRMPLIELAGKPARPPQG